MRLIDADALMNRIEDSARNAGFSQEAYCKIKRFVATTPTIEAEPVRHRKWILDDLGRACCTVCEKLIPYVEEYDTDEDCGGTYEVEIDETPYCPNCGAKMDLEG